MATARSKPAPKTHAALAAYDPADMQRVAQGRHFDPSTILGLQQHQALDSLLLFQPAAENLRVLTDAGWQAMQRIEESDFFHWQGSPKICGKHPLIEQHSKDGACFRYRDAYSFPPDIDPQQLAHFNHGTLWQAHDLLGVRMMERDGVQGTRFTVWAPNAERVSVVGDFNHWDGRQLPMINLGNSGIWYLFVPGILAGEVYKFEILNGAQLVIKSDPYGRAFEHRPATASKVLPPSSHRWCDTEWMNKRQQCSANWLENALSIYEVHLGSWRRDHHNAPLTYRQLADSLIPYVTQMGFTHIQLMPISEYPYDASWGYQVSGYFAPTSRYGSADDLKYFIDRCHQHEIGVLLDWVPAHFPKDSHALAQFDGTALYEHEDPRKGEHRDWGTLIFNYGRTEVKNFLLSSAYMWLHEFHIDGLRVDAVASMLYLDYSRKDDDWVPNIHGGNENLEAVEFLRTLNTVLHRECPGALVIAEESTSWPQVSRPVYLGGLGFSMKWNMGWMNDTLNYFAKEPVHRAFHHERLTFSQIYAYRENFVLPLSHDEVVHGKGSILNKMPGDPWQKFANVRLLYTYLFSHPGKKLLFMGNEFAQGAEWQFDRALDWQVLDFPLQQGVQRLVSDLNRLYRGDRPLHQYDFEQRGFEWLDCHDHNQSVLSFIRRSADDFTLVVLNFTPVPRHGYRIGVPEPGLYTEVLNSDSVYYEGSNVNNGESIQSQAQAWMGHPCSLSLSVPPLAGLIIKKRLA